MIRWFRLALTVMLLGASAGCATQASPLLVHEANPQALVIAVPKGDTADSLTQAAERYTRASGEMVQVEAIGTEAFLDQVAAVFLAGLERYDLVYLPAEAVAKWADYKAIRPIPFTPDQTTLGPWLPAVSVKGQIYGLPVAPDPVVLWYRTDLFQAGGLGVPRDWAAFRRAAQVLNAPPNRYGAVIAGSDLDSAGDFAALLAGFGGQAVSDTYVLQLTDEPARQALAFYTGLHTDGLVSKRADQFTRADVQAALLKDEAAMGIAPLSAAAALQDCSAQSKVCQGGQPLLAWAWLPGLVETSAVGDLSAWVLPLHAPHAQAAERFTAWLASADGAAAWASSGGIPAYRGALAALPPVEDSSAANKTASAEAVKKKAAAEAARVALARLETYHLTLPQVANADTLIQAYSSAIHAAIAGDRSPEQALQAAAEQMRHTLRMEQ